MLTPHDVLNLWSPICDPSVWVRGSRGWAHSIARPWVPTSSPLTHMVYHLPFLRCWLQMRFDIGSPLVFVAPSILSKLSRPPWFGELGGTWGSGMGPFDDPPLPLSSYLAGSKTVSARPSAPRYDDRYRSRSYCFVERQKRLCTRIHMCNLNETTIRNECNA